MKSIATRTIRQYLKQEVKRLEQSIKQQEERLARVPHLEGDQGDHVNNLLEQSHARIVLEQFQQQLSRVEAARGRLAEGKYGICEDCDRAIPAERLEAIPYATLCVTCQSRRERGGGARPAAASRALRAV